MRERGSEPEDVSGSLERTKGDEDIVGRAGGGGRERVERSDGEKREKKRVGDPRAAPDRGYLINSARGASTLIEIFGLLVIVFVSTCMYYTHGGFFY